jgi:GntR family transcriptional repressor for pyruvate dehydrogenase complex
LGTTANNSKVSIAHAICNTFLVKKILTNWSNQNMGTLVGPIILFIKVMKVKNLTLVKELKPIKRENIYKTIARQIESLITSGKLKDGDRLPPERDLAKAFGVSRHSVREAMRTLEEKLIMAQAILKEKNKLSEIFQFRRMLEPYIASLAAKNATPEDIAHCESILLKQTRKETSFNVEDMVNLDKAFHICLAKVSKNRILFRVSETINNILQECRDKAYQGKFRLDKSVEGHKRILLAIKKKDPNLASSEMHDHIRLIEDLVLRRFDGTS